MTVLSFVAYATLGLIIMAVVPAAYVLLREWRTRRVERRRREQEEAAFSVLKTMRPPELLTSLPPRPGAAPTEFDLQGRFDARTLERAMVRVLRTHMREDRYVELFHQLGYTEHFLGAVRKSSSWAERAHAAEVLGLLGTPEACKPLVEALRDPYEDVTVKRAASDALGRIRVGSATPLLADELRAGDDAAAPIVAEALLRFGTTAVTPLLGVLRTAERPAARRWAARILGRLGAFEAVAALRARLLDADAEVRAAAAEALGRIGDTSVGERLVALAQSDPSAAVRAAAVRALGRLGDEASVAALISALTDPDHATRLRGLEAIELIRPDDTGPVEHLLRDPVAEVRRRAAIVLDRIGYLDRCVDAVATGDEQAVARALSRLRELADAGLTESIARYAGDARPRARAAAVTVAVAFGDERERALIETAARDEDAGVRLAAVRALAAREAGSEVLWELLHDDDETVVEAAADVLLATGAVAAPDLFETLCDAASAGRAALRARAVRLLGRVDDVRVGERILRAAGDLDPGVRLAALEAWPVATLPLGQLLEHLVDPVASVRRAAVAALGRTATEGACEALLRLLPGADEAQRDAVSSALAVQGLIAAPAFAGRLDEIIAARDVDTLLGVATALGQAGGAEVVRPLIRMLEVGVPHLRTRVVEALCRLEGDEALQAVLRAADDPDPQTRIAAVNAIGALPTVDPEVARALLRRKIGDPDPEVRNRAAIALAGRTADALEGMDAGWVDDAPLTLALGLSGRHEALTRASARLAQPEARRRVLALLEGETPAVRRRFLENLSLPADDPRAAVTEEGLLRSAATTLRSGADPEVRGRALAILGGIDGEAATRVVADAVVSDPAASVRQAAVALLAGRMQHAAARDGLRKAIGDPGDAVARGAAQALAVAEDAGSTDALLARMGRARGPLVADLEEALVCVHRAAPERLLHILLARGERDLVAVGLGIVRKIGDASVAPLLRDLLHADEPEVVAAALRAAGRCAFDALAPRIEAALHHPDEQVRLAAVDALADAGSALAIEALRTAEIDPSATVRARLATSLGGLEVEADDNLYDALLADPRALVRAAAQVSLAAHATGPALRRLSRCEVDAEVTVLVRSDARCAPVVERLAQVLSTHAEPAVRASAVRAVAALAGEEAEALLFALGDPAPAVRLAAIEALTPITDPAIRARLRQVVAEDRDASVRAAARRASLQLVAGDRSA